MIRKLKVNLLLLVFTLTAFLSNAQDIPQTTTKTADTIIAPSAIDSLAIKATDSVPVKKINIEDVNFSKVNSYILGGISVKGNEQFSDQSITVFSELRVGQPIKIPGDKLTGAIKKLWNSKLFSNVDVYVTKIDDKTIYLEFEVQELTKISSVTVEGVKKNKGEELIKETEFKKGAMLTENLLTTTKNYIKKKYIDKGFLKTKVNINTKVDTTDNNAEKALIVIDKGNKIKIKNLRFSGNVKHEDKWLAKQLKKTKEKKFYRFWKPSKYIEEEYEADLEKLIGKYQEKGYRDAQILKDSISWNDDNTINLDITVNEGKKYYFGNIEFLGNTVYSDTILQEFIGLEKGDIYNGKLLNERIKGDGSPDSQDITNFYLNNGYLFSSVIPVETKVENDTIDIQIRIREDEPANIRKITLVGNEVTNDYVLLREMRTMPGQLFSREDIIRTIREVGQLPYIDPESIVPDVQPNYADKTVDIEYSVVEKGASQIELQGGFGGSTFIGTLGLSFSNFSIKNIFKGSEYKPVPRGDGQSVALRAQASRFSNSYSLSFTEPWFGGKKPKSLSLSVYSSSQFSYNYQTNKVDKNQKLNIIGATLALNQRLKWPDDYFTLSTAISYQRFNLDNFFLGTFGFNNGISNNLSLGLNFSRSSAGYNPIFPTLGSTFSIGAKLTPPYSLFDSKDKDYENLTSAERFKLLEYYKLNFSGKWFSKIMGKPQHELVLMSNVEFGFLGAYNNELGVSPFERFYLGGDGLASGQFDGRTTVGLRGYENNSLSSNLGSTIYNKFSLELRYPITLKPTASIYVLGFLEGGKAFDDFNNFAPFNLKRSAGAGIRIHMPAFGLLGIDFAKGFDTDLVTPGQSVHFIIGQQF
ncbi:outer membrane protein assembly factor BamA [Aureibaculum sp. A20]|uniref:Outer membrane protein assembly factor BamA n=1 Tax=Aureibaculum flavum TaxID=2795986 RepID=A0ABS0WVU1_9FLAO|nr:outer membrane protein assembly factor BamA [Aureibaculum flavum]MBJ2176097.1 outer membrane protein assembly factor BamA [Aureibaculum flavum]